MIGASYRAVGSVHICEFQFFSKGPGVPFGGVPHALGIPLKVLLSHVYRTLLTVLHTCSMTSDFFQSEPWNACPENTPEIQESIRTVERSQEVALDGGTRGQSYLVTYFTIDILIRIKTQINLHASKRLTKRWLAQFTKNAERDVL